MAFTIRVHQIDGVTGAVGLVCDRPDADDAIPTGAVRVDPAVLAELLATIDAGIETLVFLTVEDADHVDAATARVVRLVAGLRNTPGHVAAIRRVPAVNAAKRVADGVVVEAVDRETLNLLRPPEVVDRQTLETMLERLGSNRGDDLINPTVLAASEGGRVLVVDDNDNPVSTPDAPPTRT